MAKLEATRRTDSGTRKTRVLRAQGQTPAVIYGHGEENVPIALSEHDLDVAIGHGERILEVHLGDKTENVLIKDVQYDTFGQHILHVDLTRVNLSDRVEIVVPVVLRGTPAGLTEGGVLQQQANELTVECLVTAIPEDVRIMVNDLNVGDSLHANDVELPEGVTLVTDPGQMVCSVTVVAEEVEAEVEGEEGEAAMPEVIGEKKDEDDTEGGEGDA